MNVEAVRSKQGFALATALLYVAIITTAFASVTSLILTEYRITRNSTARTQALYAAEAGIDLALHEFNQEAQGTVAWAGWAGRGTSHRLDAVPELLRQECTFNPELSVVADSTSLSITAIGRVTASAGSPAVSRHVVVTLKRDGWVYGIQRWEEK